jgi:hypothetical protein
MRFGEINIRHSFGKDSNTVIKVRGNGCRNVRDERCSCRELQVMVCEEFKQIRMR